MYVSYKAIGRNIRQARTNANLTQEQTAERLRISLLHFGRLERGDRPASLEQIAQIAHVLEVKPSSLLVGAIEGDDLDANVPESATALGKAVGKLAAGCSKQGCRTIYAAARAIAEEDKRAAEE